MTSVVVFGFAVQEGLPPVVGAAPYPILARQLPRLLVTRLNQGGDRGARFFPFLGKREDRRVFLELRELLEPAALLRLHGQDAPTCLVDGILEAGTLRLRILDGRSGAVRFDEALPFDPLAPLDALRRALFEVTGALQWSGRPPDLPALSGEALAWYLVAKDDLLSLEADIARQPEEALRAARKCVELAPQDGEVRDLLLELCARLVRAGAALPTVAEVLERAAERVDPGGDGREFLAGAAGVLEACQEVERAASLYDRLARARPGDSEAAERAAGLLFTMGRLQQARELLELARAAGARSVALTAQLAAVCDRLGDRQARDELCEELLAASQRPVKVARLLAQFLLERQQPEAALEVVGEALREADADPGLLLEKGRALLLLERNAEAEAALRDCLQRQPAAAIAAEARRLLQYSAMPDLLPTMARVEESLQRGASRAALRPVRALVRRYPRQPEPWLLLGIAHHRLRHRRRAERALRRALSLDPDLAEAHNRLGVLLLARGRHRQGYEHLQRAVRGLPGEPGPHLHLAQACFLLGRREDGERHLLQAERLGAAPATLALLRREFSIPEP